jgi:hypothetical protein
MNTTNTPTTIPTTEERLDTTTANNETNATNTESRSTTTPNLETNGTNTVTTALGELKVRYADPAYALVSLARDTQAYRLRFQVPFAQLALELEKSDTWLRQLIGFLSLPADILEKAEQEHAGFSKLQSLKATTKSTTTSPTLPNNQTNGTNTPHVSTTTTPNTDTTTPNNGINTLNPGYPLLRQSVSVGLQFLRIWAWPKDFGDQVGELVEEYAIRVGALKWLKVTALLALYGLAGYGAYMAYNTIRHAAFGMRQEVLLNKNNLIPHAASRTPHDVDSSSGFVSQRWVSGHRLELRWTPVADAVKYRVYAQDPLGRDERILGEVSTAGAVVSVSHFADRSLIGVTAINAADEETAIEGFAEFTPTAINDRDRIEPIALEVAQVPTANVGSSRNSGYPGAAASGTRQAVSKKQPLAAVTGHPPSQENPPSLSLSAPVELHSLVKTPDLIRLTWRAVAADAHYNVYSSASRELTALRKENDHPLKMNTVDWTPETGLERYWVVVTALDGAGHESPYSEAIEVVRHPDKSGPNGMDEAAGAIRRMIKW